MEHSHETQQGLQGIEPSWAEPPKMVKALDPQIYDAMDSGSEPVH